MTDLSFIGGVLFLAMLVLGIAVAVAVFGINGLLRRIEFQQKQTNALLRQLIDEPPSKA